MVYSLTTATEQVLTGSVKQIAYEMDCSDKYLYGMLSEDKTDIFAPFRRLYAAAVRAGASVCHWDNDLASIRARYEKLQPKRSIVECLIEKIRSGADTAARLVDALKDGEISESEAGRIQAAIDKEKQNLALLETHLHFARAD